MNKKRKSFILFIYFNGASTICSVTFNNKGCEEEATMTVTISQMLNFKWGFRCSCRRCFLNAAKYKIQKPSTCRATLFRCKFVSMFSVFHLTWSTCPAKKKNICFWSWHVFSCNFLTTSAKRRLWIFIFEVLTTIRTRSGKILILCLYRKTKKAKVHYYLVQRDQYGVIAKHLTRPGQSFFFFYETFSLQ